MARTMIQFQGATLTLVGRTLTVGVAAPFFKALTADLKEATLIRFRGKVKVLTSFPSLDTPVCDMQVKEFNKKAARLSNDIAVIGISDDLPFAQKRFCDMNDIRNVTILSDYKYHSFGINYGLHIKELSLLARAVIIVDKSDTVRYVQVVKELTHAPDYGEVLSALDKVLRLPASEGASLQELHCVPCEAGTPPLDKEKIASRVRGVPGWQLIEDAKLTRDFAFKDFTDAKYFVDLVAFIAEEQNHHPRITIHYNKVKVTLTTHASGGLTENDFIMAHIISQLEEGK